MRKKQEQQNSQNSLGEWTPLSSNRSNSTSLVDGVASTSNRRRTASTRQQNNNNDDDEWKMRTPSKRQQHGSLTAGCNSSGGGSSSNFNSGIKNNRNKLLPLEEATANLSESKQSQLERHKDLLKKSILRKRSLLERNLQNEIREEVEVKVKRHVRAMSVTTPEKQTENNERTSVFTERVVDQNIEHKRLVDRGRGTRIEVELIYLSLAVSSSPQLGVAWAPENRSRCTAGTAAWAGPRN